MAETLSPTEPGMRALERQGRTIYRWLLISPLITVPCMLLGLALAEMAQQEQQERAVQAARQSDARGIRGTEPSWSPDGARLAFVSERAGSESIYVVDLEGGELELVIGGPLVDYDPAWSPDGQSLAFSSDRDGDFDIYLAQSDGSDVMQITDDPANDENPSWSPDGQRIAFYSDRDGNQEIYVVDRDGGEARNLTRDPADDWPPAWSPDGELIAFGSTRQGSWDIFVMDPEGGNVRNLTYEEADDEWPAWSPDARWIAFFSERTGDREIFVMTPSGQRVTNLSQNSAGDFLPAWSPDGKHIAFVSNRADGVERLFVMNANGTNPRPLTHGLAPVPARPALPSNLWVALAVALPGLVHFVLLAGWMSPHLYVRRHSQMALGFASLRTLSATLILGLTDGQAVGAWAAVNGSLWLFASLWGFRQVARGDNWLMRRLGEGSLLPPAWAGVDAARDIPSGIPLATHGPLDDSQALASPTQPDILKEGIMNASPTTVPVRSEDLAHGQIVIVTARWILVFAGLLLALWNSTDVSQLRVQILFILALAFANFYLHAQILMRRPAISSVIYAASAADLTVISVNVLSSGGFESQTFAFYFPALLVLSVAFPGAMTLLYTGATVGFYSLVGLGEIAFADGDLQTLVIRDLMLIGVAVCGSLYLRMENRRRSEALRGDSQAEARPEEGVPAGA